MKKLIASILILSSILALVSCGNGSDVPEGMQLVRGGEDIGYYMYAPEEWIIANQGSISAAYASTVDTSSVSYVECDMPEVTVAEYFEESLSEFPTAPTNVQGPTNTTFGNADEAIAYEYDHDYLGHSFRTMQIFVKYGERFGIFTFTAVLENVSSDELTQYEYYEEKLAAVITNFKFVNKSGEETKTVYETDEDGYRLVSDKRVAKFSLYLPEEFEVEYSSGIVSARLSDGSNINIASATSTGVVVSDYWETRKNELTAIVTNLTEIKVNQPASLGNSKNAFSYEYTYEYNGTIYHVYQILAVTTFNGFVFTYTATDANYSLHIEEILKIAEKVEF